MTQPKIVFCTTCKNRTEHLELTLPKNIADNTDYANCSFVVLNYGSQDHMEEFLQSPQFGPLIESGRLAVYKHNAEGPFHVSHAKNMAARCGILEGANILVTVDADNFTGPKLAQFIANKFSLDGGVRPGIFLCPNFPHIQSLPHGPGRPERGYAGRLAIRAQDFVKMGGYDEHFNTWHGEDMDMIFRLQKLGFQMRHIDNHFLKAIPHSAEVRFREYPEAIQFENKRELKAIRARTGTVVNFGKFGVGVVARSMPNGLLQTTDLEPVPTRVFGIGMQKTGTSSLHAAFQILGLDSFHWGRGEAPRMWHEMNSTGRSNTLEQHYALSDNPIPVMFEKLDRAYPGSKFILTIRDEQSWLQSVERLWDRRYNPTRWMWDVYPFSNTIHTAMYGQKDFDADVFRARYRRHSAEVLEYFSGRPGDLLVLDMDSESDKWLAICQFLGVPIPVVPFPLKNQTSVVGCREEEAFVANTSEGETPNCWPENGQY
jgi:hypothetical protein